MPCMICLAVIKQSPLMGTLRCPRLHSGWYVIYGVTYATGTRFHSHRLAAFRAQWVVCGLLNQYRCSAFHFPFFFSMNFIYNNRGELHWHSYGWQWWNKNYALTISFLDHAERQACGCDMRQAILPCQVVDLHLATQHSSTKCIVIQPWQASVFLALNGNLLPSHSLYLDLINDSKPTLDCAQLFWRPSSEEYWERLVSGRLLQACSLK